MQVSNFSMIFVRVFVIIHAWNILSLNTGLDCSFPFFLTNVDLPMADRFVPNGLYAGTTACQREHGGKHSVSLSMFCTQSLEAPG